MPATIKNASPTAEISPARTSISFCQLQNHDPPPTMVKSALKPRHFRRGGEATPLDQVGGFAWDIKTYIQEHPTEAGWYVVEGVVFIAPGLIAGPLLGMLGFTSVGLLQVRLTPPSTRFVRQVIFHQAASLPGECQLSAPLLVDASTRSCRVRECADMALLWSTGLCEDAPSSRRR